MTLDTTSVAGERARAGRPRPMWRSVAIPSEHGGWGLTLEPVLLGLLVAPSAAGLAIGAAAFVAFIARTPVKLALVDRHRRRKLDRTRLAARLASVEVGVLVGLVVIAVVTARGPFWAPLVVAAPLVLVELWFDMRSRSRRLVPELAGAVGICSVAAAIVLAGGGPAALAAGLWAVLGARSVASIPFVRLQLQRAKQQAHRVWTSDVAQLAAVAVVAAAWWLGWLPAAVVGVIAVLGAIEVVLARLRPPKAVIVGVQQLFVGMAVVVATAIVTHA